MTDRVVTVAVSSAAPSARVPIAEAFRPVKALIACYCAVNLITLGIAFALRHHASLVPPSVWVRGTIVTVTSFILLAVAGRAAQGHQRAYLRLRIISIVLLVAVVAVVAVPGTFPVWMKVTQAVCGVLLAGVVVISHRPSVRVGFSR